MENTFKTQQLELLPTFKVDRIEVTGASDYRDEYISSLLKPLLSHNEYTYQELLDTAAKVEGNVKKDFDSMKVVVDRGDEAAGSGKLKIDLRRAKLDNWTLSSYTTHFGAGMKLQYLNNNLIGSGEQLRVWSSVSEFFEGQNHGLRFSAPFNTVLGKLVLSTDYASGKWSQTAEDAASDAEALVGFQKSLALWGVGFETLKGVSIVQNTGSDGTISSKTSFVSSNKVTKLHSLGAGAHSFPLAGFSAEYVQEVARYNKEDNRNVSRSQMKLGLHKTLGGLTFSHKSVLAFIKDTSVKRSAHDQFSLRSLYGHTRTTNGTSVLGNCLFGTQLSVYSKVPVFNKYVSDETGVLRLRAFADYSGVSETLSECKNKLAGLPNKWASDVALGVGIVYKSEYGNLDLGYNFSENSTMKHGLQFGASIALA